jgi:hypothetical protein
MRDKNSDIKSGPGLSCLLSVYTSPSPSMIAFGLGLVILNQGLLAHAYVPLGSRADNATTTVPDTGCPGKINIYMYSIEYMITYFFITMFG